MNINKRINKKENIELQEYLQFKRRGHFVKSKKGKGSYSRIKANKQIKEMGD